MLELDEELVVDVLSGAVQTKTVDPEVPELQPPTPSPPFPPVPVVESHPSIAPTVPIATTTASKGLRRNERGMDMMASRGWWLGMGWRTLVH